MNDALVHSFPGKLLAKPLNQAEKSSVDANAHEMGLVSSLLLRCRPPEREFVE